MGAGVRDAFPPPMCVWFCLLVKTVHMNQHHRCCTFVSPGLIEHSEIYPG